MKSRLSHRTYRLALSIVFTISATVMAWLAIWFVQPDFLSTSTDGELMTRLLAPPLLFALASLTGLMGCANKATPVAPTAVTTATVHESSKPFMAQVVGLQWLNPLQRRDYPTEWQLLWTMGLVKPNEQDEMVRTKPQKYTSVQPVYAIADGDNGKASFNDMHAQYFSALIVPFHDIYFSSSKYFYNAHAVKDKSTRRELAGIHIEYALPTQKLDTERASGYSRKTISRIFAIGNPNYPTAWTTATPPDVRVTSGGPNAGFKSLAAALDYLRENPTETVWAMSWDAPNFPPKEDQLNENMTLLVLAGPNYQTGRAPLAWIGYPVTRDPATFEVKKDLPPRVVQAWQAALAAAAENAGKETLDIGYTIHDANTSYPDSSVRIGNLAQTLMMSSPEFDFNKQSFNTPALLGEMGAATALTNVALGIAYANHFGKNVLVAGTTDVDKPTAVIVVPPEKVRPIDHAADWFRARGENHAHLMWWGLRHDAPAYIQGYSQ